MSKPTYFHKSAPLCGKMVCFPIIFERNTHRKIREHWQKTKRSREHRKMKREQRKNKTGARMEKCKGEQWVKMWREQGARTPSPNRASLIQKAKTVMIFIEHSAIYLTEQPLTRLERTWVTIYHLLPQSVISDPYPSNIAPDSNFQSEICSSCKRGFLADHVLQIFQQLGQLCHWSYYQVLTKNSAFP